MRSGSVYRALLWLAAIIGLTALIYGLVSTPVLAGDRWTPIGAVRFARYTKLFGLVYLVLAVVLRRHLAVLIALPVLSMTILGTGAIPFLAVVLMCISCTVLGRWLFRTPQWMLAFLGGLCVW